MNKASSSLRASLIQIVTTIGALKSIHISEEVVLQIAALCHCILLSAKTLLNSTVTYRFVCDIDHTAAEDNSTNKEDDRSVPDCNVWEDRDPYLEEDSDHSSDRDDSAKANKGIKGSKWLIIVHCQS